MKRLAAISLLFLFLFTLAACSKTPGGSEEPPQEEVPETPPENPPENPPEEPPQEDAGAEVTLYRCGEVEIALPSRYLPALTVKTGGEAENGFQPLLSVYETASLEAAEADFGSSDGFGFLFGFAALTQAALEQYLCTLPTGMDIFAEDANFYYAYTYPTDVQYYRGGGEISTGSQDWANWQELNELGSEVQAGMIGRNNLQPYSTDAFFKQEFTYDGEHVYLNYYPNYTSGGDGQEFYTLTLSQPIRQGSGGIWCVERMADPNGSVYYYFPDSGKPAYEYYEELQASCDAGENKELLTPLGAAKFFVKQSAWFGGEAAADESFRPVPDAGG